MKGERKKEGGYEGRREENMKKKGEMGRKEDR